MKRPVLLIVALLWICRPGTAKELRFQFRSQIDARFDQEEIVAVPLGPEVYAATRDDWADLRVLDRNRIEQPWLIRPVREYRRQSRRRFHSVNKPELTPLENGGLEIRVTRRDTHRAAHGLRLHTPLKNFQQRITVYGSDNETDWELLTENALVFDYSQWMDVRNDEVPLPENTFRYLRIVIDKVTAEQESQLMETVRHLRGGAEADRTERVTIDRRPFRIDRIEYWEETVEERVEGDKKILYPPVAFRIEHDSQARSTFVYVQTNREPLTAFVIETPDRSFSRRVTVEIPATGQEQVHWQAVGSSVVSRIDFQGFRRERVRVTFPETRSKRYRLAIANGDNQPLRVTGVKGEGTLYRVVFLAAAGNQYHLVYGAPEAEPPHYDTTALKELLRRGYRPVEAKLAARQGGPPPEPGAENPFAWFLGTSGALIVLVVALVAVLGFTLYAAAKRIGQIPES